MHRDVIRKSTARLGGGFGEEIPHSERLWTITRGPLWEVQQLNLTLGCGTTLRSHVRRAWAFKSFSD